MMGELEATIWCPSCRVEKFEVWRVPLESETVFQHVVRPASVPLDARKRCGCGAQLERKP